MVAIHNAVNERAWREILRWETEHGGSGEAPPRLVKFRQVGMAKGAEVGGARAALQAGLAGLWWQSCAVNVAIPAILHSSGRAVKGAA